MLTKGTKQFAKILFWQEIFKWVEVLFAVTFFVAIFWFFYLSLCNAGSCSTFLISNEVENNLIELFFIVWGLLNSVRIGLVFLINDPDPEPEYLFYVSLVGLFISNILFGLFFSDFVSRAEKGQVDAPVFIAEVVVLMFTVGSLLADRQTWDKSTTFVKIRISLSILELVVLLINPYLGIILAVFVIPVSVILKGGLEIEHEEQ